MTKLAELKNRWMEDPEFRRGYEDASYEFALSEALSQARAKAKMPQDSGTPRLRTAQSVKRKA